ncbi:MAG TPA: hypothetical protein VFT10_02180, partial [Solirubrobacterales bacterium]|nr:hypothetical protein [Solirubrobacterales bacterium]
YPEEWRRSVATATEVGNAWLDPEVTLRRQGDPRVSMTAGMLRTAADSGRLPGPPRGLGTPARIQAGSLLALRYPPRTSDGGWRRSVVVLPTESGFVALACRAPVAIAASAAASCRALLARLRADAGAAESWRAGSGYMRFLQSDVNLSEALRLGEERGFGAKSLDARAQAAGKIATGYRVLGDDLAERRPPPAERVAAKRLEAASRSSSRAFRRMAKAARDRDRASYAAALDAVRASSAARLAALRDFRLAGYRVDIRRERPCAECGS